MPSKLYAFTNDDPDGNGKNDTYGLSGDGYDFRSFWPWEIAERIPDPERDASAGRFLGMGLTAVPEKRDAL